MIRNRIHGHVFILQVFILHKNCLKVKNEDPFYFLRTHTASKEILIGLFCFYWLHYAANVIFVPDIFNRNLSGISPSICMMAFRPVQ
jgi:hypothetical protein